MANRALAKKLKLTGRKRPAVVNAPAGYDLGVSGKLSGKHLVGVRPAAVQARRSTAGLALTSADVECGRPARTGRASSPDR